MLSERLLIDLSAILSPDQIIVDPVELSVYESDGFTIARARPAAVLFPRDTRQTADVLKTLSRHDVPIVPRGSGTGLAGGCVGFENGVVVSTARMTRILLIDLPNRAAHVEAGVRNLSLSDAVAALPGGSVYHFAPDPSSQRASTIGGNAATNAGGVHTLKDFVTSNHILGLELVLPDGTVLELGAANGCQDIHGFDLPALVCGSEGTMGIITKLWVRLVPKATSFRTGVALFNESADACAVVSEVIAAGMLPAAMEMMDGVMVRVVDDAYGFGFPHEAQALLLFELDGIDELLDGQMERIKEICARHHPISFESSADPERRAKIWKARKGVFGAIGRISHSYCTQDACVPRSQLGEVLKRIGDIGREFGLTIPSAFHAGDGNIHPIFLYDDADPQQTRNTMRAAEKVLQYCIDIGGTLTGEHGVGVEKLHLMPYLFDESTMNQFQRVKEAFDPEDRINAGKLLPSDKIQVKMV
jgi:glycolate oxidase